MITRLILYTAALWFAWRGAPPRLIRLYRSAHLYRRCNRLLARVDDAIERGDRATAEKLMEQVRVVVARARSAEGDL